MARDRKSDAHRTIAQRVAGRKLAPREVVDHIDEDKSNNTPGNLRVMTRAQHTAQHNRARGVSKLRAALRMVKEGKKVY